VLSLCQFIDDEFCERVRTKRTNAHLAVGFIALDLSLQALDFQVLSGGNPFQRLLPTVGYQSLQTDYSPKIRTTPAAFLDLLDRSFEFFNMLGWIH